MIRILAFYKIKLSTRDYSQEFDVPLTLSLVLNQWEESDYLRFAL